jgi:YrbI family 3-deoxy-D-manno-octulosonate 8-phosphate phosphatase
VYKEIKVVCFDVDGTLTDGTYQISSSGEVTKSFHTRDFYAIEQLLRAGLTVVIITQSHDDVMKEQLKRIYSHSVFWSRMAGEGKLLLFGAVQNKVHEIEKMFRSGAMGWENVAYMGDAENDRECITYAGFSGCPADSIPILQRIVLYPSSYNGGHGAVHDFCMNLLEKRNKESKNENS